MKTLNEAIDNAKTLYDFEKLLLINDKQNEVAIPVRSAYEIELIGAINNMTKSFQQAEPQKQNIAALDSQPPTSSNRGSSRGSRTNTARRNITCFYCNKAGHIEANCFKKKNDLQYRGRGYNYGRGRSFNSFRGNYRGRSNYNNNYRRGSNNNYSNYNSYDDKTKPNEAYMKGYMDAREELRKQGN